MTQTTNRFFDEVARLMNDAAGVAQGVRREFDTLFRPRPSAGCATSIWSSARSSRPSRTWPGSRARRTRPSRPAIAALEGKLAGAGPAPGGFGGGAASGGPSDAPVPGS